MDIVKSARLASGIIAFALGATVAFAQAPVRPPYGTAVTLEAAKKIAAGAMAEAKKQKWNVAVAIVDNHGMLIYYEMMDDTQTASERLALEKARTSAMLRRPTKELEQGIASGAVQYVTAGVIALEGGLPIIVDGKVTGAIGVSGMAAPQDGVIARAGLDALK
jgi:glc operon protein GlcG